MHLGFVKASAGQKICEACGGVVKSLFLCIHVSLGLSFHCFGVCSYSDPNPCYVALQSYYKPFTEVYVT